MTPGHKPDWKLIRNTLWNRSHGRCEVSGAPLERDTFDVHHRRNRGMGGTRRTDVHGYVNLLALHPGIHNGGPGSVHGRRGWSEERGYLIPKHIDLIQHYPVWLYGALWALLQPDGSGYQFLKRVPPPT